MKGIVLDEITVQGLRNGLKLRGQSDMNFSKWGQNAAHLSKYMSAIEYF